MESLPLAARARGHGARPALVDAAGTYSYDDLLGASARIAAALLGDRSDLEEARVAYFIPPSFDHIAVHGFDTKLAFHLVHKR